MGMAGIMEEDFSLIPYRKTVWTSDTLRNNKSTLPTLSQSKYFGRRILCMHAAEEERKEGRKKVLHAALNPIFFDDTRRQRIF
jgi:hypothetical protein